MTLDSTVPRSRRAILAGGLGGLAALAASALARPEGVRAGVDGDVVLGGVNATDAATVIQNETNDLTVLKADSFGEGIGLAGTSQSGIGVLGESGGAAIGVLAKSVAGHGLHGRSESDTAVYAEGIDGIGVFAVSYSGSSSASVGHSAAHATGVQGWSGDIPPTGPKPKTGVHGQADQDASSRGVFGQSLAGQGVRGQSTTGRGVNGYATTGVGVWGEATTGYALRTAGRVRLDKSAGLASIASGSSNVAVNPGIDLTTSSAVVATVNGNPGGTTAVQRVLIDTAANTFTIYLTANATASVKVAWIVLG